MAALVRADKDALLACKERLGGRDQLEPSRLAGPVLFWLCSAQWRVGHLQARGIDRRRRTAGVGERGRARSAELAVGQERPGEEQLLGRMRVPLDVGRRERSGLEVAKLFEVAVVLAQLIHHLAPVVFVALRRLQEEVGVERVQMCGRDEL